MLECRLKLFISNASFDTVHAVIVSAVHSRMSTVKNNNQRQIHHLLWPANANSLFDRGMLDTAVKP